MILPKTKEIEDYLKLRKKLWVLQYAKDVGSIKKAYEFYEVKKTTFYKWIRAYKKHSERGLLRQKPIAHNLVLSHLICLTSEESYLW